MSFTFSQIVTFDTSAIGFQADLESAMQNIEKTAYGQYLLEKLISLYPDGIVIRSLSNPVSMRKGDRFIFDIEMTRSVNYAKTGENNIEEYTASYRAAWT